MFAKHSCGDSKLSCVGCSSQVCPKCLVQCPVGNRCKACANKTESHTVKVTAAVLLKTGVSAATVGALFGTLCSHMPMYGYFSWIILYAGGLLVGNLLHKVSGFKLGSRIGSVVAGALIVGAILVPTFRQAPESERVLAMMEIMQEREEAAPVGADKVDAAERDDVLPSATKAGSDTRVDLQARDTSHADTVHNRLTEAYLKKTREQANSARLMSNLVALAIFCFGALSPFAGIAPLSWGRFRR